MDLTAHAKIRWTGRLLSVQPRIRLLRSCDKRAHSTWATRWE